MIFVFSLTVCPIGKELCMKKDSFSSRKAVFLSDFISNCSVSSGLGLVFRHVHMLHRARRAVLVEEHAAVSDGALGLAGTAL